MKAWIEIEVNGREELLKAIYESLLPETTRPPSIECRVSMGLGSRLVIKIECDRINLLRAVANSYLGMLSTIIHSLEEIGYG